MAACHKIDTTEEKFTSTWRRRGQGLVTCLIRSHFCTRRHQWLSCEERGHLTQWSDSSQWWGHKCESGLWCELPKNIHVFPLYKSVNSAYISFIIQPRCPSCFTQFTLPLSRERETTILAAKSETGGGKKWNERRAFEGGCKWLLKTRLRGYLRRAAFCLVHVQCNLNECS